MNYCFNVFPYIFPAMLTSYSADSAVEREDGTKCSTDGYNCSSLNIWQQEGQPVVASTLSSSVRSTSRTNGSSMYRIEESLYASTYSLNKLHPNRGSSCSRSSGSTHSIALNLIPRPNSVAGKMTVCCSVFQCVHAHMHTHPPPSHTHTHTGRNFITFSHSQQSGKYYKHSYQLLSKQDSFC